MAFFLYLIALVLGVLLFGAVHTYAYTAAFLCVLVAGMILLVQGVTRSPENGRYTLTFVKTPLDLLFGLLLVYYTCQLIPLPQPLLALLSPRTLEIGRSTLPYFPPSSSQGLTHKWFPLALYGYPVRQAMVRLVVYWLMVRGLIAVLTSPGRIHLAVMTILGLGCFEALYGLAQTFSGAEQVWWYAKSSYQGHVTGTYINYNHLAGLLEMAGLLAAGFVLALSRRRKEREPATDSGSLTRLSRRLLPPDRTGQMRLIVILCTVVMGVGLIFSQSRGAMISVGVTGIGLAVFFLFRKSAWNFIALPAFLLVGIVSYAALVGLEAPAERFHSMGGALEERLRFSRTTLAISRDYPLTGAGAGSFRYVYPGYKSRADVNRIVQYAHNDWAQFLAENGLFGLGLLAAGIVGSLVPTLRLWRKRRDPYARILFGTSLAIFFCLGVHSLADFNLRLPGNCLVLAAVGAVGYSALHVKRGKRGTRMLYTYAVWPVRGKGGWCLLAVAGLILWTGTTVIRHFMAEAACHTVRNQTLHRDQTPAVREVLRAIYWDPDNAAYWFKLAVTLQEEQQEDQTSQGTAGRPQLVLRALETAARRNPFQSWYHVNLAWEYFRLWEQTGHYAPWMARLRTAVKNAVDRPGPDPYLHCEIGNLWIAVLDARRPASPENTPEWAKALEHYQQAVVMERPYKQGRLIRQIQNFVGAFYPEKTPAEQQLRAESPFFPK